MSSKNTPVVWALLLIAIVLGVAVYFKYNPMEKESSSGTPMEGSSGSEQVSTPAELTEDQKIMFLPPGENPTKAELDLFSSTVAKHAVPGNAITVNNCTSTPDVLKLPYGSDFTVNNTGTTEIHFGFGEDRTLIAPGASAKLKANYKTGPGTYGYGCDDKTLNRAIGVLLITEKGQ